MPNEIRNCIIPTDNISNYSLSSNKHTFASAVGGGTSNYYRGFGYSDDTHLLFYNCVIQGSSNHNNQVCVPTRIFGLMKTSSESNPSDEIKRLKSHRVTVPSNTSTSYSSITLDVRGVNTLSLIANKTDGTVNVSYINLYEADSSTLIKQYSVSSAPQTVDVSAYDEVKLLIYVLNGTTAYKGIEISDIQMY